MTLDEWRATKVPALEVRPLPVFGMLWNLKARGACGHLGPCYYEVLMDGESVGRSGGKKLCAECCLEEMRKVFAEITSTAIPCAACGRMITAGTAVGGAFPMGTPSLPLAYFEDEPALAAACCRHTLARLWDGTRLRRLTRDEMRTYAELDAYRAAIGGP